MANSAKGTAKKSPAPTAAQRPTQAEPLQKLPATAAKAPTSIYVLMVGFAPIIAPYASEATTLGPHLKPPSEAHWFDTAPSAAIPSTPPSMAPALASSPSR